jgi:hypothetical protein
MYRQVGLRAVLTAAGGSSLTGMVGSGHQFAGHRLSGAMLLLVGALAVTLALQVAVVVAVVLAAVAARAAVQRRGGRHLAGRTGGPGARAARGRAGLMARGAISARMLGGAR